MASLTNTKIKDTYDGLLKTTDNDALGGTYKLITDGLGNSSGVYLGTGGNVGIGTTSPNAKLTVDSGSNGVAGYINVDSQTTNRLKIGYSFTDAPSGIGAAQIFVDSSGNLDISSRGNNASNIQFYTSSGTSPSEVMRITSSGNVGIGTTDPNGKLDIATTTSTDIFNLRIHNLTANSTQSTGILFNTGYTSASRGKGGLIYEYDSSLGWNRGDFHFLQRQGGGAAIAGLEDSVLTIKNNGNVGIGTTSPQAKLQIQDGNLYFKNDSYGDDNRIGFGNPARNGDAAFIDYIGNGDFTGSLVFGVVTSSSNTAATEIARFDNSGYFGIGTTSPNFKTHLYDTGNAVLGITAGIDNYAALQFGRTTDTTRGAIEYYTGDDSLRLKTGNNTERMRIDSSGNVGIGTTSPDTFLHIDSASTNNIPLKVESGASTSFVQFMDTATTANFKVRVGSSGDNLVLFAGGSERLRIDSNGNVGIGETSPDRILHLKSSVPAIRLEDSDVSGLYHEFLATAAGEFQFKADGGNVQSNSSFTFTIDGSEKMRITSSGHLYVGTTGFPSASQSGLAIYKDSNGTQIYNSRSLTSSTNQIYFYNPNGLVGSISTSGSSTSYNTSSDYRLKENVVDMTGALDRVDQLEPKRFNFISNAETTVDGFIAHEVQSVIPEAVFGEKDAVDDEGNPEYQGIDQSKIVPLLVGAIKELKAEIETLKSQINS